MTLLARVVLALLVLGTAAAAQATAMAVPLTEPQLQQLAAQAAWQRLLHRPLGGGPSQVLSDDFFLSPQGREDAVAELRATLQALQAPWTEAQPHAACRFPARRQWLGEQLGWPGAHEPDRRCQRLWAWLDFDQLRSASVALVSGYFGNPASAFGHALLRFDGGRGAETGGLSDLGVNFGALVPENEPMLRYVLRGLSGGYVAGFSDKDFIEHDQVYVRAENRDMWNYRLPLDPAQLRLLALHVYEIAGRQFTYYFLNRNCAWRLAELLELVLPQPLRQGADEAWFVPVELFHRLEAQRVPATVVFTPSAQRRLMWHLAQLSPPERRVLEAVLADPALALEPALNALQPDQQQRVLAVLLDWASWRNPESAQGPDWAHPNQIKHGAVLARLRRPAGEAALRPVPEQPSPAQGTPPMRWQWGVQQPRHGDALALARWAAVSFELDGFHGMADGELRVADLQLAWRQRLRLQAATLLAVRKLNGPQALPEESNYAWQLHLGADRDAQDRLQWRAQGGLGYSWGWGAQWQLYSFANLGLRVRDPSLAWRPEAGALWRGSAWRAHLSWQAAWGGDGPSTWSAALSRRLARDQVIQLRVLRERDWRAELNWQLFR